MQFLSYGQSHWLMSIHTIFQWFTCYENSHCQQFMPNLCYIVYIDLFIMAFGLQTITNDSCLFLYYIWSKWWVSSRVTFNFMSLWLLKAFSRIFPMGGWGGPEKDQNYCSWFSTAGHPIVHHCHLYCLDLLCLVLVCHLSFQALSHFFLTSDFL